MDEKIYKGKIYTKDFNFRPGKVVCKDGIITEVTFFESEDSDDDFVYIIPGLVDIHMHGAKMVDICNLDADKLKVLSQYEKENGITSFCPTTMTVSEDRLISICEVIKELKTDGIVGINLEGPFISKDKCGAQDCVNVIKAEGRIDDLLDRLQNISGGMIRLVTVAPENEGVVDGIKRLHKRFHFSIGHTNADYEKCKDAVSAGADHITHLYNGMSYVNHREPGAVGAAFDSDEVFVELICDGNHIHPSLVRNAYNAIGAKRLVLISDSTEATGCDDGEYLLGTTDILKFKNKAVLKDNKDVLAGSVCNLFDCFKIAVKDVGIPLEDAVRTVTYNPAKSIGLEDKIGVIDVGRRADILLLDREMNIIKIT